MLDWSSKVPNLIAKSKGPQRRPSRQARFTRVLIGIGKRIPMPRHVRVRRGAPDEVVPRLPALVRQTSGVAGTGASITATSPPRTRGGAYHQGIERPLVRLQASLRDTRVRVCRRLRAARPLRATQAAQASEMRGFRNLRPTSWLLRLRIASALI